MPQSPTHQPPLRRSPKYLLHPAPCAPPPPLFRRCFTVPAGAAAPTLLVAEHGNGRVQEVDVAAWTHAGFPMVGRPSHPRGVAASAALIAVTSWGVVKTGAHVVALFDAGTRAWLRDVGTLGSDPGKVRARVF